MDNANSKEYLDKILGQVVENLKRTTFAPSVQMTDVPREPLVESMDDEADAILDDLDEDENKDKRFTKRRFDQYIEKDGELSDSEDDEEQTANGIRRQPNSLKRRNKVSYRNIDADSGVDSGIATPRDESSIPDDELGLDEKMDDVEDVDVQDKRSPSVAEPALRSDSRLDADDASAVEGNDIAGHEVDDDDPAVSAPASSHDSPQENAELDTTMEDAAPEPVSTASPTILSATREKTPPKAPAFDGPPAHGTTPPIELMEDTETTAEAASKADTPLETEEDHLKH
jgi:histone deacetylase 1/2